MSLLLDSFASGKTEFTEYELKNLKETINDSMKPSFQKSKKIIDDHQTMLTEKATKLADLVQVSQKLQCDLQNQKEKFTIFRDKLKKEIEQRKKIMENLAKEHEASLIYDAIREFKRLKIELKNSLTNSDLLLSLELAQRLFEISNKLHAINVFNSLKEHIYSPILKSQFSNLVILQPTSIQFPNISNLLQVFKLMDIFDLIPDFLSYICNYILINFLPSLSKNGISETKTIQQTTSFTIHTLSLPHTPASFLQSANSFYEQFEKFLSLYNISLNSNPELDPNLSNSKISENNEEENLIKQNIEDSFEDQFREKILSLITEIPGDANDLQTSLDHLCELTHFHEKIDANALIHGSRIPPMLLACRDAIARGQEMWSVHNLMLEMLKNAEVPGALKNVATIGLIFWKDQPKKLTQAINCFVVLNTEESFECMLMYKKVLNELNQ